jgi:hypothetical protein
VTAVGSPALSYQWTFNGTNISGATTSSLTLSNVTTVQAGSYQVVVANAASNITSSVATLTVNPTFEAIGWTKMWSLGGGSQPYLSSTNQNERGIGYNPLSNRLLLISRGSGTRVVALNGDNGNYLHDLTVNTNVINGGTFALLMIGVAEDGAVYAGNLITAGNTTAFRLYRWANDNAGTTATLAYSGDPGNGNAQRWGDTLDVRGSGTNTQVIIASRSGTVVSVLTTTNGTTFAATPLAVAGIENGAFGLGLSFGLNNTFWGKSIALPLRQVQFNLNDATATVLRSYATNVFPGTISPIGVEPSLNHLAGISMSNVDSLQLFNLNIDDSAPIWIASTNFASANLNSFYCGAVDFVGDRVYALDSNNGITAMRLLQPATPPSVVASPQSVVTNQGATVTFTVSANGTAPLAFQWIVNGTNLAGATQSTLTRTNVQPADAGSYLATVSNMAGSTNSATATLTVNVPPTLVLQPVNQTVRIGKNVTFSASANGTEPLFYQWRLNGSNISTGAILALSNVQTNSAGSYSVVVTNIAGSIQSTNAVLVVTLPPQFQAPSIASNGVVLLNFNGDSGTNYLIESSSNLVDWLPLTNVVATNGTANLLDADATNASGRFYRARQ